MRLTGLGLIVLAVAAPLLWFPQYTAELGLDATISHFVGLSALVLMAIILVLATRLKPLEAIFGSLDQIYVLHKWLGVAALATVVIHNTISPEFSGMNETFLSEIGESFGGTAHDMLWVLLVITVITLIPYRLWRWTHKLMGAVYLLSAIHFWLTPKTFALNTPLGLYISLFCILGIAASIYTLLPIRGLKRTVDYRVSRVEKTGGATAITLTPLDKSISHKPGQFAFINFDHSSLKETHPFTISQAPQEDSSLRFTIKALGDYTGRLQSTQLIGVKAEVLGAYGHFSYKKKAKRYIWIAAGVGITPFVAWANALEDTETPIDLFFAVKSKQQAPHIEELEAICAARQNIQLHLIESQKGNRLSTRVIDGQLSPNWRKTHVAFCGPANLRKSLQTELRKLGLSRHRFQYEAFEIRTGVGLTPVIRFGLTMAVKRVPLLTTLWTSSYSKLPSWLK